MKLCLFSLLLLFCFSASAQNLELDDVFPKLKKIKDKNIDFEGCVTGDCTGGKGIYMTVKTTSTTSRSNAPDFTSVTVYIFNGEFSENGEVFKGKEYGLNTKYFDTKKKQEPAFTGLIDGSDHELDPFLNYEGEFKKQNGTYLRHGKGGTFHFSIIADNNIKNHVIDYYNGYKNREIITYDAGYEHKSFEGWIQPGDKKSLGKLVFANGDTYIGTFFNDQFEGLGKLVTSTGTKEGFWKEGELIQEEKITMSDLALSGDKTDSTNIYISQSQYLTLKKGDYLGNHVNSVPNGQGIFFNYWGHISAGNFIDGKLNGMGFRLTTESLVKHNIGYQYYPCTRETGIFVEGDLADGLRETSELASSKGAPYDYKFQKPITITPSKEVVSINAVTSEVAFKSTDIDAQYKQAADLMEQDQYDKALYLFLKLIDQQGYNSNFKVQASFCYLMLQDIDHASIYAQQAINVNQTEFTAYLVKGLAEIAQDDLPAAKKSFKEAFYFDYSGDQNTYTKSLEAMTEVDLNKGGCDLMLDFIQGNYHNRDKSYAAVREEMTKADQNVQNDPIAARTHFNAAIQKSATITSRPWLKAFNTYVAGGTFYYANLFNEAEPFIEQAYLEVIDHKSSINPYPRLFLNTVLAEYASNTGDNSKIQGYLNNSVPLVAELGDYANDLKAKHYQSECNLYEQTNQYELLIASANKLKDLQKTGYDNFYKAKALNYLGMGYAKSGTAAGRKTSFDYYEQSLSLAQEKGYEPIVEDIEANLPLAYWQAGEKQKAISIYRNTIQKGIDNKNFKDAEISANNLAFLLFYEEDYGNAIEYFEQAIALTEKARLSLSGKERITYMQGKTSAYQGLIYSLAKLNRVEEVFNAQQKDRARVLLETLSQESKSQEISLSDFQKTLGASETAVFYSLFEAGTVVITTVSKDIAKVVVSDQKAGFLELKTNYLDMVYEGKPGYNPINIEQALRFANVEDRMASQLKNNDMNLMMELYRGVIDKSIATPNEAFRGKLLNELASQYHAFLIKPIESQLIGKNKLMLFPDGLLNFLPFEALRPAGTSTYLVQDFDVSYGHSAGVTDFLRKRVYSSDRKPFLAMGGALYGRMNEHDQVDKNNLSYTDLQVQATENAEKGQSQRMVYASLFGEKMDYLAGTLAEVDNLSSIFKESKIYRGEEMSETNIKALSRSKELQNYKIIHLATHGFAVPEIPELSGIAMCIFPDVQNGEDGYLTAPEIAKLNMNADLVVLSACETALGKVYGGEGVAGLTQSILEGGANSTMVSLWPVNDAGTMYFMTGLYELTENQGKTYNEAISIMKRKFISGDFGDSFKDIQIWAPFVFYGF